jgi:hypothetical protein
MRHKVAHAVHGTGSHKWLQNSCFWLCCKGLVVATVYRRLDYQILVVLVPVVDLACLQVPVQYVMPKAVMSISYVNLAKDF